MDVVEASSSKPENETMDVKTLISFHSNQLWNRLISFFPSSNSSLLGKFSSIYLRMARTRSRKRRPTLPLPLPSKSIDSSEVMTEASIVFEVLEDILEHIFLNMHKVQKNLQFWQSRAQGSDARKLYFMIFERGPRGFIDGTAQLIRECITEGSSMQQVCHSASAYVSERISVLTDLRYSLASFLAQVYKEVDKVGDELVNNPEKSVPSLLFAVNGLFLKLEASIGHLNGVCQSDSSVDRSYSSPLLFERLPEVNQEGSQWTDCETRDAINLIYQNLHKLETYLSILVAKHQKPRKATIYWTRYTCGIVGLSVCSMWLLRHSSLMGSSDIDNWIREARDSTISFWNDHVEQPLLSIRDELFETFRKRHKGVMELEEVQLTSNSLHRMLLTFSEQTKGQVISENTSDQELLEIVMGRYEKELMHPIQNLLNGELARKKSEVLLYEKELMHPIQNLLNGELARALLIQVQKLKLDIETAMLELNQILRANEINFAILAALPAFFLSLILLVVVRAWFKQDTRAEGRGRIARLQRRLLIVEVEKRIMQYQIFVDQGQENDAQCMFGLILYSLDRLYRVVERPAKATGEWQCLRQDIIDLGKPGLQTSYKFIVTSRLERVYDCLLPSPTRK